MAVLLVFSGFCLGYVIGATSIVEHPMINAAAIGGVLAVLLAEYLKKKARHEADK